MNAPGVVQSVILGGGVVLDQLAKRWAELALRATFNLADVWITAGLLLLIVDALSPGPREREERVAAAAREGI